MSDTEAAVDEPHVPAGPSRPTRQRHQGDLARLVMALGIGLVGLAVYTVDRRTANGISLDIVALIDWIPLGVAEVLIGAIQVLALAAPVVVVVILVWNREFWALLVASVACFIGGTTLALVHTYANIGVPDEIAHRAGDVSVLFSADFPSPSYWAAAVAVSTALAPWMTKAWRQMSWVFLVLVALARIATATTVPLGIWPAFAIGAASGSAALLILGAPSRAPSGKKITDVLRHAGLDPVDVAPSSITTSRTSDPFTASTRTGDVFCKVVHRDDRDAALVWWVWRNIRVKGIEDERPISSPRFSLEHEALVALFAREAGARVPRPVVVAPIDEATALSVTDRVDARPLLALSTDELSDAVLSDLWTQVAALQDRRIAHRWLNVANVMVDVDGATWLTGFTFADQSGSDEALATDVAELLASLALLVGPERAVAPAVAALGPDRVSAALQLLQPLALTSATRARVHKDKELLPALRDEVVRVTGAEAVELVKLERIGMRSVLMLVATVAVVYIMLVQFSKAGDIGDALAEADWVWLGPILVLTALTFPAAALSLIGAVQGTLPLLRTTVVQLGQTFLNRFTPMNAGGMALRVRYLQKRGHSAVDGAAAVGLTSAASGVMQGVFFVVFVVLAGAHADTPTVNLPDMSLVALIILVVGLIGGAVILTPWGRRVLVKPAIDIVKSATHTITSIARNPAKMSLLFGGAGLSKLFYMAAFFASCQAFGIDLNFVAVGAVYMLATTVGGAVPTPGGLGGVEAALVAFLTAAGVDASLAVPTMLVFRLATFWLPVIPGYIAFWYLSRTDVV